MTVNQTRADSAREPLSIADYRDLHDGNRSFEGMGAAFQWSANLTGGEAERLQGMKASASLFAILRTPAALGRVLVPEDDAGDGRRVAILTHGLWTRRYGSDPAVLGSALVLNGDAYTIVGVLPRGFITPVRDAEVVVPFAMETDPRRKLRDSGFLRVIGRLRPGVTIEQARADLDAIMQRLRLEYPATNATHLGTAIVEWRRALATTQRPLLLLLQGAVALVLVVACANVANLLLAAAVRREHEFAVRAAIGGSRSRLVRQLSFEALIIAAAAALGAIAIQRATAQSLSVLAPPDLLATAEFARSVRRVLAFTLTAALLATLIFGVVPVLRLGTTSGTLRAGRTSAPSTRRVRSALVTAEVAVASMLVTIAVLLSQSFAKLQSVETGFRADGLLTARLSLPRSRYRGAADSARFVDALRPRLLALPGVEDAAAVNVVPLNGYHATTDVWPADRPAPDPGRRPQAQYRMITPSYLRTFGVPLLAGRPLDEHDGRGAEPVVLVSRTLAVRFWTVPDAVGKMLTIEDGETPRQARIVGVVGDVKHYGLDTEVTPDLYTPVPQVPDVTVQWLNNNMYWGVRTRRRPGGAGRFLPARVEGGGRRRAGRRDPHNERRARYLAGAAPAEPGAGAGVRRAGARAGGRRRLCRHRVLGRAATARDRHQIRARRRNDSHRADRRRRRAAAGCRRAHRGRRRRPARLAVPAGGALSGGTRRRGSLVARLGCAVRGRPHRGAVRRAADPAHRRDRSAAVGIEVSRSYSDRRNASRSALSRSLSVAVRRALRHEARSRSTEECDDARMSVAVLTNR